MQCRTSSNSTSGSKGDVEPDEVEDELGKSKIYSARRCRKGELGGGGGGDGGSGDTRVPRRKSPPKHVNRSSSGSNKYSTTAYISNGEDNAVNISITSNGNVPDTREKNTSLGSNQSKNLSNSRRTIPSAIGANNNTHIKGRTKFAPF